jgi:hypothetical protein
VKKARTISKYTLVQKDRFSEKVNPPESSTFLLVYVEAYNLGHKSYTIQYGEYSPDEGNFRVFYQGYIYTPLNVMGTVKSGIYEWKPYTKTLLDLYEHTGGILLFEMSQSINLENSYL